MMISMSMKIRMESLRIRKISGLYAITPDLLETEGLLEKVRLILAGGVRLIQYRNKKACAELRREQAYSLLKLCRSSGVPLIINDYIDLAIEMDADGVHVGQTDLCVVEARKQLGQGKIIGASCYDSLQLAIQAEKDGADYVAFGAFYPSVTKLDTATASIELLCQAKEKIAVPVVGIGGIRLHNARCLIEHGCESLAVSNGLFHADDVQMTAAGFSHCFESSSATHN